MFQKLKLERIGGGEISGQDQFCRPVLFQKLKLERIREKIFLQKFLGEKKNFRLGSFL